MRTCRFSVSIRFKVKHLLHVLLVVPAFASALAAEPSAPAFIVHTIDGPLSPAPVHKLTGAWDLHLGGTIARVLSGQDWINLRRERTALPAFPDKNFALLTTGDRLLLKPGAPFRLEDERIILSLEHSVQIEVPNAYLSLVCLQVPEGQGDASQFLTRLSTTKRARDVLFLKSGERLEGTLAFPSGGPLYTMNLGERAAQTHLDQIAIVAVNTELQVRPRPKKTYAHVVTTRGARIQFNRLTLDQGKLTGRTLFGADMQVPLSQVAALDLRLGAAVYLSDLVPKSYEHTPFLGLRWPLVSDAAVTGRQLHLGGAYYDKGLGMHTKGLVTYTLDGSYAWFEALAGVADKGRAQVSVLVDGLNKIGPTELAQGKTLPVRIDVSKAREVTLVADFGLFGDVHGHVNWADARLIRSKDAR